MAFTEGKTSKGWGVIRSSPWHFAGLFSDQEEAGLKAAAMGAGYIVAYGETRDGTDDFVYSMSE